MSPEPSQTEPRPTGTGHATAEAQRHWRRTTGRVRTCRVPLLDLGRVLATGTSRTRRDLEALVGPDTAAAAREVYANHHLSPEPSTAVG